MSLTLRTAGVSASTSLPIAARNVCCGPCTRSRSQKNWASTRATASVGKGALALLAVVVLDRKAAHAVLLVGLVTVVMHLAFRGYVYMYLRHQRVAKLYQFTRALSGSVEATQISERAAREARDLLRAQAAELALHGAVEHVVRYDGGGNLTVGTIRMADAPVIVVVNDSHDLYPGILRRAGLELETRSTRHVNRRTGFRAGEFYEDVLVCRA